MPFLVRSIHSLFHPPISEFHPIVLEYSSVIKINRHVIVVVCIWATALNSIVLGIVVAHAVAVQRHISCFEREEDVLAAVHCFDLANDGDSELKKMTQEMHVDEITARGREIVPLGPGCRRWR